MKGNSCRNILSVLICLILFFHTSVRLIVNIKISSVFIGATTITSLSEVWQGQNNCLWQRCISVGAEAQTCSWAPSFSHCPLSVSPLSPPTPPPVLKQADRMGVIYNVLSLSIAAKWYEVNQGRSNERLRIHSCEHILSVVSVMVAAPEEAGMRRAEGP